MFFYTSADTMTRVQRQHKQTTPPPPTMPLFNLKASTKGDAAGTPYVPPPPISEQKRLRRSDQSLVPPAPHLLASHFLDVVCDTVPGIRSSWACPPPEDGGWRSTLPGWLPGERAKAWGREAVTFPSGKLSHSFLGSLDEEDTGPLLTLGEHASSWEARKAEVGHMGNGSRENSSRYADTCARYYDFAFQTDSSTLSDLTDNTALAVLFLLVVLLRSVKRRVLPKFCYLGRRLGRSAHGPDWELDNRERVIKFGEYVYRLIFHSAISAYGLWYFWDAPWWGKGGTVSLFDGHPNHPVPPGMAWYYLIQAAYNVDALVSLAELSLTVEWVNPLSYSSALDFLERDQTVDETQRREQVFKLMAKSRRSRVIWTPLFELKWSPTVRGDFREMMAHHLVTNALIFFSSYYRVTRFGSATLLIHDVSDVPIDLSKLANFVKWKVTTIVCFTLMVFMWAVTRLLVFPFVLCWSCYYESKEYLVDKGTLDPASYGAYCYLFHGPMWTLVLLHITWFLILLRIGWTLVSTGERHDYSEFKGGEGSKQKRT
ncbi:hypothetical protein ACHAWF_004570 [Thalassiosira exigua]